MTVDQVLETSPLTSRLSLEVRDEFRSIFKEETYPKATQANQWGADRFFVLIVQGKIEVSRFSVETGRSLTIFLLGPGDGFDILRLLDGEQHDVHSEALEQLTVLKTPYEEVRNFMACHPEFNRAFLPYLGKQFRELEDMATDLGLYSSLTRLARLVLREQGTSNGVTVPLLDTLSDEILANRIGSVRQTVNKHLQTWRKHHIIDKSKILNLEALEAIAQLRLTELGNRRERSGL